MFAPRPSAESATDRRIEHLERLAALLAGGALSREEFEREKRRVLGDGADPAPDVPGVAPRGGAYRRPIDSRLGWFILGLALLALVAWITLASPDPRATPVAAEAPSAGYPDGGTATLSPAVFAGGWADERTGCTLGEKDRFDYFAADGRYGGWGGFGGTTDEGRWALNGATLIETITHHTGNNEARAPQRLREPQVRTFDVALAAPGHLVVTGPTGGVGRLVRCPDAHFEFAAKG